MNLYLVIVIPYNTDVLINIREYAIFYGLFIYSFFYDIYFILKAMKNNTD